MEEKFGHIGHLDYRFSRKVSFLRLNRSTALTEYAIRNEDRPVVTTFGNIICKCNPPSFCLNLPDELT